MRWWRSILFSMVKAKNFLALNRICLVSLIRFEIPILHWLLSRAIAFPACGEFYARESDTEASQCLHS
jgi:hypothetical protein